jgi:hypothetical protein
MNTGVPKLFKSKGEQIEVFQTFRSEEEQANSFQKFPEQ